MKNISNLKFLNRRGVSLIELLFAISLIGFFVGMVVPRFGGSFGYDETRDRRNAQTIATLASGASACGVSVVDSNNVQASIERLVAGHVVPSGVFKGKTFKVNLNEQEITNAARYLRVDGDALVYAFDRS